MVNSTVERSLQEECGLVAFYNKEPESVLQVALLAAGGVQHRGQNGAGLAVKTSKNLYLYKGSGLLQQVFTKEVVQSYDKPARWIAVHCRYGTFGSYLKKNLQPCFVRSAKKERIIAAHNGEFVAVDSIQKRLQTTSTEGISDTYLFTQLLATMDGKSWDEKIMKVLSYVKGSYNLIIGIEDTLYIARDPMGIRPLALGERKNGWMIASETHAFDKVGIRVERSVRKGEIIKIDRKGLHVLNKESQGSYHFCDFEWAYFSRPDSLLPIHGNGNGKADEWMSVTSFRERCGTILAKEFPIKGATFAVGLPDSGIPFTAGYANSLHIPYRQVIIRDHYDPNASHRLFMRDDKKKQISKKVLGKLSLVPDKTIWRNAIVILGDDSIVRGNVSKQITKAVFALGAKEVHWIIGFPPVQHKCHLGVSMRTEEELIAYNHKGDQKKIAAEIGATSVNYISKIGFVRARLLSGKITVPKNEQEIFLRNGGCGGCITGLYPLGRDGKSYFPYKHFTNN